MGENSSLYRFETCFHLARKEKAMKKNSRDKEANENP